MQDLKFCKQDSVSFLTFFIFVLFKHTDNDKRHLGTEGPAATQGIDPCTEKGVRSDGRVVWVMLKEKSQSKVIAGELSDTHH